MPISVRVLAFARIRELIGRSEFLFPIPEATTIRGLWNALVAGTPALSEFTDCIRFACNSTIAPDSTPLHDRDEVALLPPVSGG
ncbi:MAG: molybdopterin converting factor subunit 1 [Vulcanimicrobiaceae bacterium]